MNQDQPELTLEESVKQVMQTLPPLIRNYLAQGKYTAVAKEMMAKYGLRVDQSGVLEREIMLLLMGIEDPDEFTQTLAEEARLDQKVIMGIVQDINAQIFVPLRDEMRKGATTVPRNDEGQTSLNPGTPGLPKLIPSQKPGGTTQSHFHLQNKITAPIQPQPLRGETPKLPPVEEKKLLDDHEESHIEFHKTAPPPNLPGVIHHPPITPPPPSTPPIPPPLLLSPEPKTAVQYSVDPYREPIDEK